MRRGSSWRARRKNSLATIVFQNSSAAEMTTFALRAAALCAALACTNAWILPGA